jgi:toxin-antitoxin system PIN domain toxin
MTWLLDVNVLIAALVDGHEHHRPVESWLKSLPLDDALATCSITELGFARVLYQSPQFRIPITNSISLLSLFLSTNARQVIRLPDDRGAADLPDWVATGRQITDGHLLGLALRNGATLVTLDRGIPGAFVVEP